MTGPLVTNQQRNAIDYDPSVREQVAAELAARLRPEGPKQGAGYSSRDEVQRALAQEGLSAFRFNAHTLGEISIAAALDLWERKNYHLSPEEKARRAKQKPEREPVAPSNNPKPRAHLATPEPRFTRRLKLDAPLTDSQAAEQGVSDALKLLKALAAGPASESRAGSQRDDANDFSKAKGPVAGRALRAACFA